jgi:hypothetical protein
MLYRVHIYCYIYMTTFCVSKDKYISIYLHLWLGFFHKTDRHDITEILLKVALTLNPNYSKENGLYHHLSIRKYKRLKKDKIGKRWLHLNQYRYLLKKQYNTMIYCSIRFSSLISHWGWFCWFMVFMATFNNISVISWPSVLLVEETEYLEKSTYLPQVTDKLILFKSEPTSDVFDFQY